MEASKGELKIFTAPPDSGIVSLGLTIPYLLDYACENYPNDAAFNKAGENGWDSLSNSAFRTAAEEGALGFASIGLTRGDRIAMFMHSDSDFCLVDVACAIGGFVDVPLYLTNATNINEHVLNHSESELIVVSDRELLEKVAPALLNAPTIKKIVLVHGDYPPGFDSGSRGLLKWDEVRSAGREALQADPESIARLKSSISPHDLATLIYTSGTTGLPKGVMLSHENMTSNAVTSYSGLGDLGWGKEETSLSFLPMSHVFARTMYYGCMHRGISTYFTTPDDLAVALKDVRPTIFATVPRVLEKVYDKILLKGGETKGLKRKIFDWSMKLAGQYELGAPQSSKFKRDLRWADRLVFSKWRAAVGGRLKYAIVGSAALNGKLANAFAAAKIVCLQGYGLTETSPVITYNRPQLNRAGSVGVAMCGVEVAIAEDGEIITRGPHVMKGYYKNPEVTAESIDSDNWFHTGDIGEINDEGFLKITDRKKSLFKLSTGKYVVPQPVETRLVSDPLIENAMLVGTNEKYCTALLFANVEALRQKAGELGLPEDPLEKILESKAIQNHFQKAIEMANKGMSHWETVKKFKVVLEGPTQENGMLTPTLKIKRRPVADRYKEEIASMYSE